MYIILVTTLSNFIVKFYIFMDDAPIGDHFQFHCTCDNKNKDILFYSIP